MPTATFYLLDELHSDPQKCILDKVCQLSHLFCQQGMKIYIATNDKVQAEQVDEALWQRPGEYFIPHNLIGEGPRGGAQVEIGEARMGRSRLRQVLINLGNDAAAFAPTFAQVIDFVLCDEIGKQQARARYKIYRSAGCQMRTLPFDAFS